MRYFIVIFLIIIKKRIFLNIHNYFMDFQIPEDLITEAREDKLQKKSR